MPRDDRDLNFEKALGRHLRSEASPQIEAAARPSNCADAEVLAAYHERLLSPDELNFWKEHIAGCARCQEILAQLEITDEIAVNAHDEELSLAGAPAASRKAVAISSAVAPVELPVAKPSQVRNMPSGPQTAKSGSEKVVSISRWRWLAPAGAIAAGLLVWIVIHEEKKSVISPTVQVAANQPAIPSPELDKEAALSRNAAPLRSTPELSKPQKQGVELNGNLGDRVSTNQQAAVNLSNQQHLKQQVMDGSRLDAPNAPSLNQDSKMHEERAAGQGPKPSEATNRRDFSQLEKSAPGMLAYEAAPPASPISPKKTDSVSESAEVSGSAGALTNKDKLPVAAPAPPASKANALAKPDFQAALREKTPNFRLIVPPGGNTLWRAGAAGLIERSSDRGNTWLPQISGVAANLTGGSAVNDLVCWVIGDSGTILRTMDGGMHWTRASSPATNGLGTIEARDALNATILDPSGRKAYTTKDGGATWIRVAGE